jgi:alpha-amylase/alpha-mannosidase (GH57 family)
MTMKPSICIHGHFYQPPRENPWLESVELQDSAYPYHDWNERITAECYAPNSASRILDGEGRIECIVNNYAKISFNFGPTLLDWLRKNAKETYEAILAADAESQRLFSGHGSALAQAYNHMILPLANRRDKITQVAWGIYDFEQHFGRRPEGMWLPEAAVNLESLEILAEHDIHFTILSPYSAHRVREIGGRGWSDVSGGRVDPSMAYRVRLRSGRAITVFFYDGPIARSIAFEGLLTRGENLAQRLAGAFSEARTWPQLLHVATDGETYGHHHRHGEMALAYALHYIEANGLGEITNYGEFLERHPPTHEVQIYENSSWSCAHGIERWRSNCGCNSGLHPGWQQHWRGPLRRALDSLRDSLAARYERQASRLFLQPWKARDDYIQVVLDRSPENVESFFRRNTSGALIPPEKTQALKLLELQRHAMLMQTSCGWFFDEVSGIETVQVLQYAGRALQLSEQLLGDRLETDFLARLERAPSNIGEFENGRRVYELFVKPAKVDAEKVGAHYAVSSVFESYEAETRMHCYTVKREDQRLLTAGKARLLLGRAQITSQITWESTPVSFGVLHLGDHNLSGGVRQYQGEEAYAGMVQQIAEVFERGDLSEALRAVDRSFGSGIYTLKLLFRDEQRKILGQILSVTLESAEAAYRGLYHEHASLLQFVASLGLPPPKKLLAAAEFTLNADLRGSLEAEPLHGERVRSLLDEARKVGVELDQTTLEFALRRKIERLASEFRTQPTEVTHLRVLQEAVVLASSLPFEVNLWHAQNVFYRILQELYPELRARAEKGDEEAGAWVNHFVALGEKLLVRVE